jgi:HK97 family phage prohead protease
MDERGAVRIGGQVTNPGGTERLHEYWVHGEGAAKIRWGTPGDFSRCVDHLGKFIKDPQGYCNLAHHAALGIYPATHAKEIHAGRAAMADTKAKPYGDVKYADPKNGKYPVDTKDHAMAAWSYINMPKNAGMYPMNGVTLSEVKDRIMAACRKFGIDMAGDTASRADDGDSSSGRAESLATFTRSVPFEEISIRSDGDGRVVSAYAAVFDTPAPIHDADGDYIEVLDPAVFNKAISDARPAGNRKSWRIGVFYNHGMTIMGTPSDRYSMPCGKILDVAADGRGLWTEIRYHRSAVGDEVLENIREGTSGGYSFSGRFLRSNPRIPRSGFQKDHRTGELPTVRRTESTLRELGWTPFPAYQEAEVMGTRAQLLAAITADPELATRMLSMFRDGTPPEPPPPPGTPPDEEPPPRSRLVHSGRSVREQIQANTALLLQRQYRR